MTEIVVGVDGSTESRRALEWAVKRAHKTGAVIRAVYVYALPAQWAEPRAPLMVSTREMGPFEPYGEVATLARRRQTEITAEAHQQAQDRLKVAVSALAGSARGLDIVVEAVCGHRPAQVLVERSKDADLLVVGSRGRGGFAGLLLGSVSQQCAQHAHCPVVVIR